MILHGWVRPGITTTGTQLTRASKLALFVDLTHFSGKFSLEILSDRNYSDETHTEVLFNLEFEMGKNESFSRRHTPKWKSSNPDDITRWPKCSASPEKMLEIGRKTSRDAPPWMTCNVNARPCCIGTEGQCKIVSKEYCDTMEVRRVIFSASLFFVGEMAWRCIFMFPSRLFGGYLWAGSFPHSLRSRSNLSTSFVSFHPRWNFTSLHNALLPGEIIFCSRF